MYSYIKGTVEEINLDYVVIDNNNIGYNCKELSGSMYMDLGEVNGFIDIKYRKDQTQSSGEDVFRFKVEFTN